MPNIQLTKLRVALEALNRPNKSSISKIASTAKQFIKRAVIKEKKTPPRITKPPQGIKLSEVLTFDDPFIKHERDAFRMKAFTLLNHYSTQDKLNWLREAPIKRIIHPDSKEIQLMQVFSPFPGEQIELKGSFRRHSIRAEHTAPVAGSFKVMTKSEISGFPHPSQHTGWSLSSEMIKDPEILLVMSSIRTKLKPGTKERQNVVEWTRCKDEAFDETCSIALQDFMKLVVKDASLIKAVFSWAATRNSLFSSLSQVHAFMQFEERFISLYQQHLKEFKHSYLNQCAEQQLTQFQCTLQTPPPQSADEVKQNILDAIKADRTLLTQPC